MPISLYPQFFFISILSTIICITNFTHAYSQCLEDQKALLLELKNELTFNSSFSRKLVQWNQTDDCCSWEGVECDGAGHVISLQLDNEAISGELEHSSSLFSLRHLKMLNLAYNNFDETHIPRGICNLTYLTRLNLSSAGFGGPVPVELSLLRRLVSLDISWNLGIRSLNKHPNLTMLLKNLTGLTELYLDGISISAQWCHVISSSLPDLRILSLQNCDLSGPLDPSLLELRSLSILRLNENNLSTTVPNFFANFSSLSILSLSDCSLQGSFPELIFQVPTLQILDLSRNELLNGTIPQFPQSSAFRSIMFNSTSLSGSSPDSFSKVSMLSHIDLSFCGFSGPIPSTLANLTELIYVDLSHNFFTGLIPTFYMSNKLTYIDLSSNSLRGSLSSMHLEGLPNLVYVNLGDNSLSGSIPRSLFGLPSVQVLMLYNNQFNGQFDEFPTLNNMQQLDLRSNRLEGPIPKSFFKLESLEVLSLSYNFFNGTVQLGMLRWLRNLTRLELSYNNLSVDASSTNLGPSMFPNLNRLSLASCNLYNFPDLRNQSNLSFLDLSNNRIAGEIPSWIWEVGNGTLFSLNLSCNLLVDLQKPYHIPSSLQVLDLHSNQLRGELPLPQAGISFVDYSNNNFDKSIPLDIGNFTSFLVFLSLANNSLSGLIPPTLCYSLNLQVLDLSLNHLSGNIPHCLFENTIMDLVVFSIRRNNISGHIPDKFLGCYSLQTLDLSSNNLGGKIPTSLAHCTSLEVLNVANNNINDHFPCMLPSSLRVLVLRSNRFHGEARCHKHWPKLQIIDIASNNLSGNLHRINFSSWRGMMVASDAQLKHASLGFTIAFPHFYYRDEVTLTIKGLELKLVKIWEDFVSIDFSCNNFWGEIPDAIGDLSSLYLLNLSHNTLNGTIPKSLGNLTQLGSLDLSVNQLGGTIPVELARLTFLSVLNLSYNKLVGVIPKGPQIQTFSVDSFEGNTGLCGLPVNISCSNTDEIDVSPPKLENVQSHERMEIEWDYVSAALGYVVGLGSFLWILLSCQSLSKKYFEKIDEVLEKIFDHQDRKRTHGRRVLIRNRI